ncbi:MAG TPA: hypothetical protein VL598_04275 [Trinickia sp.]|jgi:hypothetical protein|uniref:hypothetical protein n=1 Tax=Trinickia sp. TaxID=2571163 RepID=UPI002BA54311|nr:hypothetical protein [Trinickia sp.]HTI16859.1 hypothetical protein [Trinickia sp.]
MRHPALRRSRSARFASRRTLKNTGGAAPPSTDPSGQNRVAPNAPPDGAYNQGGARAEGLDYQRDLGIEQDA